ncbi:hypothetical protein L484_025108 [Morus notabilis]|uniref:Uncharacterized protein n=1 Tax=Morus notabilis TaxID=981085 RepID=W9RZI3_9ROSA|nr:hypothetical protein L484_025108 [Morus notabilis]
MMILSVVPPSDLGRWEVKIPPTLGDERFTSLSSATRGTCLPEVGTCPFVAASLSWARLLAAYCLLSKERAGLGRELFPLVFWLSPIPSASPRCSLRLPAELRVFLGAMIVRYSLTRIFNKPDILGLVPSGVANCRL